MLGRHQILIRFAPSIVHTTFMYSARRHHRKYSTETSYKPVRLINPPHVDSLTGYSHVLCLEGFCMFFSYFFPFSALEHRDREQKEQTSIKNRQRELIVTGTHSSRVSSAPKVSKVLSYLTTSACFCANCPPGLGSQNFSLKNSRSLGDSFVLKALKASLY